MEKQEEITNESLVKLFQANTPNIRNLCVLAHVDHGKTSLVDSLISYSNIISPRLAGDVRYMDSRPDEQARCITMKSSSISLPYHSDKFNSNYLVNLIDSPGHIDFSYEIFSALKMVDGALILIDVIEGICSQTESVIREAWDEKIKCVLVFNKIDKLITTVQLDPVEAYEHLSNLLEKVNAMMSSLILRDIEVNQLNNTNNLSRKESSNSNDIDNIIEQKENESYFSPEKGNVIFASAFDNWAFTLGTFSDILSKKFGFKKEVLQKVLWGDFYYNPKTKKISKNPFSEKSRPIFVDFILENIYKMYRMVTVEKDLEKIKKICESLNVTISTKELNKINLEKNSSLILKSIMRQWLPIPQTVFDVCIEHLPNPIEGLKTKIDILFPHAKYSHNEFVNSLRKKIFNNIIKGEDIPTVAYISKMIPLEARNIQGIEITPEKKDTLKFMAFARVFLGECRKGSEYFVIGPKHDTKSNKYDIIKFKFEDLYFFMGQYLNQLDIVPAGNIFSVGGLENNVFKTATISSSFNCPSIIPLNINKNSNIKVSIATEDIKDMSTLIQGLKKLNRCDPAVEYYVQSNGEHILVTSGEVHLQRCLKDLEDFLAKVKINISPPLVNFKEGLKNTNYTYKKEKYKKDIAKLKEDLEAIKAKERKQELENKNAVIVDGEENIDVDDQEEILKSCTPMILTVKDETKKMPKVAKHKVKDVISKNEKKAASYIEKQNFTFSQRGFYEDTTPNNFCTFGFSAVGMTEEVIDVIEKNQKLIELIEESEFCVDQETYKAVMKFKEELLEKVESKKLKKIIDNYLYSLGTKDGSINMLVIKHISKQRNYFERIKVLSEENSHNEDNNTDTTIDTITNVKLQKTETKDEEKSQTIDESISKNVHGNTTIKEFLKAIKIGFDLSLKNGPLCEENMYGVIFILEHIKFNKQKTEDEKEDEKKEEKKEETPTEKKEEEILTKKKEDEEISTEKKDEEISTDKKENIEKDLLLVGDKEKEGKGLSTDQNADSSSLSKTHISNVYGPFLGQIMSTVKDCCRQAYLAGEPRLYEGMYLCFFQIKQENVGKIHSVINKRRGEIINEIPSDESIKCTIEAVVPVVESFGFVEEIRKKSSGLANPMLQFYKWKMLDVDPFDTATEEDILNYGENIDTPNIAKNYINKIRQRKGLVTSEKIVKNADKQKNLAKKR